MSKNELVKQKVISEAFTVPQQIYSDKYGRIGVGFSAPVKTDILSDMKDGEDNSSGRRRLARKASFMDSGASSIFDKSINKYAKLDQLLKVTNAVNINIVPSAAQNVDKKDFTW